MKKYVKPVTEVLILDVQPLLGASGIDMEGKSVGTFESDALGDAESRRGSSLWDDDDEY